MTEINNISDLVRVLEENPEWLYTLQGMIISREMAAVPAQLNRLDDKVDSLDGKAIVQDGKLGSLDDKANVLDGRVSSLDDKVNVLDGKVGSLDDKVNVLDGKVSSLDDKVSVLSDQVRVLSDQVSGLDGKVNRLDGKVDNLAGPTYEAKVAQQIASIAGQHLQLGAVRIGHGQGDRRDENLPEILDAAFEESRENANLVNEVRRSDLIISGRRRSHGEREYALFEASITVADNDIHRAARRADILRQLTGHPVQGVVIGSYIPTEQRALARDQGVTAITYAD